MHLDLPKELLEKLNITDIGLPEIGFSNEAVYLLKQGYQGKDVVLKTSSRREVLEEGLILEWLTNKIEVPKVYFNSCIDQKYYLVMEKLPGDMMQKTIFDLGIEDGIVKYALLLKRIHSLDVDNFPINQSLKKRVKEALYNVENNLVKTEYFEREIKNKSAREVFDLMMSYYPTTEELVFVHGDVCMPNFIFDKAHFSGMIDVGRAGYNDLYLDIAIALRTLRYNIELYDKEMTKQHIELFLETYGIEEFDEKRFCFYVLLDELING
jgi:Aminoglycoside phosphotransferase